MGDELFPKELDQMIIQKLDKILNINFDNLNEYYRLNGVQIKYSFYFCLISFGIGMIIIILSMYLLITNPFINTSVIGLITGLFLEFFSVIIMNIHLKTQEYRRKHEKVMVKIQYFLHSWEIAKTLDENQEKKEHLNKLFEFCISKI